MPESPRWLLAKNQDAAARVILAQITPPEEDLEHVVRTIRDSIELEEAASKAAGWKAIRHPSPAVQRMLLVGVGMAVIQQAIGIDSIMFYLLFVIKGSGVKSDLGQTLALILLGTVKLVFVFVGARLFDSKGRRPLLFTSLVGCALSLVVVSCSFASKTKISELTVVLGLASYLAFFSIGVGPGNWGTSVWDTGFCFIVISRSGFFSTSLIVRFFSRCFGNIFNQYSSKSYECCYFAESHHRHRHGQYISLGCGCIDMAGFLSLARWGLLG
jgi:hypothetical protein